MKPEDILIRPLGDDCGEYNFLLKSWMRAYRHSDFGRSVPSSLYYEHISPVVQEFMRRGTTLLAIDKDDPNPRTEVVGFITSEHLSPTIPVLHFIYVKDIMRGFGIGHQLMESAGLTKDTDFFYTFYSGMGRLLRGGYPKSSHYPHLFFLRKFS